ncbi:ATP-binding protein [Streptomyces fragilis]|uniref:ATP-binding protein n=1 Tax=Streptomyces fragilis TaxID=67301 RepID=A0ABV2YAG9_9ACTN|nr:ATP-binding protein [Streptomyces fragilis]
MTTIENGNIPVHEVARKEWGWHQTPASVKLARRILRKWLASHQVKFFEDEALLCFSELLTNAIRIPSPDGWTDTVWSLYPDRLRIQVKDYSPDAPKVCYPDDECESGRGLSLVHLVSDDWGYETCTFLDGKGGYLPGKYVWFELNG